MYSLISEHSFDAAHFLKDMRANAAIYMGIVGE